MCYNRDVKDSNSISLKAVNTFIEREKVLTAFKLLVTKSKRDEVVSKLSAAYKREAERKKESAASVKSKKTFINSFGEATKREITSATYERARRRRERQAQSVFMGR